MPTFYTNFDLRIDGVTIPPPSGYSFTESDLVQNSHRNAAGKAVWDVIRQNVGQLELTWAKLDGDRLTQVVQALRGKKVFQVNFFNPLTGQRETRQFYPGDRAAELARFVNSQKYFSSLTVPFVEV